jgi:LuxR family transcriptional regulator, maltose regulon positive regulatory protein
VVDDVHELGSAEALRQLELLLMRAPPELRFVLATAERTVRAEAKPAAALGVRYVRGVLELARGRDADALVAFRATERLAGILAVPHLLVPPTRSQLVHALLRLGETERAQQFLARLARAPRPGPHRTRGPDRRDPQLA